MKKVFSILILSFAALVALDALVCHQQPAQERTPASNSSFPLERFTVFLGSSVVHGPGVPLNKTFSSVAEQRLGIPVLKEGYVGSEIYRQVLRYEEKFQKTKPSRVVWFPNRNDLFPNTILREKQRQEGITKKLATRSQRFSLKLQNLWKLGVSFEQWLDERASVQPFSARDWYYTDGLTEEMEERTFSSLEDAISVFSRSLKSQGVDFRVVFVPSRVFSHLYGWEEAKAFHQIAEMLDRSGVSWVQLHDDMRTTREFEFFLDPVHLNEFGHKQVADLTAKWLEETN